MSSRRRSGGDRTAGSGCTTGGKGRPRGARPATKLEGEGHESRHGSPLHGRRGARAPRRRQRALRPRRRALPHRAEGSPRGAREGTATLRDDPGLQRLAGPPAVFDAGFGELFIVRLAGNVLSPEVAGTMQYAGTHLKTPLFVVLGHEGCGAVHAALQVKFHGARDRSRIEELAEHPAGAGRHRPEAPLDERMHAAVEANVRWTLRRIRATPEAQAREAEGIMKLVGAVLSLSTGVVRFLEE
ncbi:MAG: carbonic anhydrase [Holophagales bacterium]|nr:carbonic anhydrase [Holophagales bacterium]